MASEEVKCNKCNKPFSRKDSLNRHLRHIHNEPLETAPTQCRIFCSICSLSKEIGGFQNYNEYHGHLKNSHSINIEETIHSFTTIDEFTKWKALDEKDVNYVSQTNHSKSGRSGDLSKIIYYHCNRSNSTGFQSNCKRNVVKKGGSIKLDGNCPSRIIARFMKDGTVGVRYIQTHVGHEMEVRTQQLSKSDQQYLLDQLKAGVSTDKILKNVRNIENSTLKRINLVTKKDLSNLARRYNLAKIRDSNEMVATAMKVKEWNADAREENGEIISENLVLQVPSQSEMLIKEEIVAFITEKGNITDDINKKEKIKLKLDECFNYINQIRTMDDNSVEVFLENFELCRNSTNKNLNLISNKRKFDKQSYYPDGKRRKN